VRTIIWAFIFTVVAVMAVHGLDISSRQFAWQEGPASFEIRPGLVDKDSEDQRGVEPSRYAR
jgi:hypothetical protein